MQGTAHVKYILGHLLRLLVGSRLIHEVPDARNHTPSTMADPTESPSIFRIPGEIRNQIYEHAVVFSQPVSIYRHSRSLDEPPDAVSALASLTPLFLTCRQFHFEASAIFYSQNKFVLPANASQAPHQAQANLLFRWFLDRIGRRNAALLRHLALPFPVDPSEFIHSHLASSSSKAPSALSEYGTHEDDNGVGGRHRSLLPVLGGRCPGLETVEFDLRWNNHWVRLLSPHTATVQIMFGRLDDALRVAFPALKRVGLCLTGGPRPAWCTVTSQDRRSSVEMAEGEWEWVCDALLEEGQGRRGWQVTVAGGDGDGSICMHDDETGTGTGADTSWTSTWYPRNPRHATARLWEPPETALQSEVHDQWTRLDLLKARARFALAWLRSPAGAAQQRDEILDWRAWRRTMLAQASPLGVPLYCPRTNASVLSRRETLKRRVLDLFASMV